MKKLSPLFFLLCTLILNAQNTLQEKINSQLIDLHEVGENDENFTGFEQLKKEIGDAKIVMLGEQSHTDETTFNTKIKLIKYLHQEMDFDILAFESSIYDCDKSWSLIQEGHDVKDALAKGIFITWADLEVMNPLYQYFEEQLERDNPLMIAGFDPQISAKLAADYFAKDLMAFVSSFDDISSYQKDIEQLQTFITRVRNGKKIKKKAIVRDITFLEKLIQVIQNKKTTERSDFWIQSLTSLKVFISDYKLKNADMDNAERDQQMANNLIWLKEKYPNKKIICWGATSHFLYNSSQIKMEDKKFKKQADDYYQSHLMMGNYLKEKYGDDLYTIGFIAHQGSFGGGRNLGIELPKENSLEYLIGQSPSDNYFLPFRDLSLEGYRSRPLGHQNMINDITIVMDGVIFNRYMERPYVDWELHFYLFPENDMWKKKKENFIQVSKLRNEQRKIKETQNRGKERA